jgi:uncharacterized membrane protein YccC
VLGQAYFLDLLGDAYNGLGHYDEAIAVLSEAAEAFRRHDAQRARAQSACSRSRRATWLRVAASWRSGTWSNACRYSVSCTCPITNGRRPGS